MAVGDLGKLGCCGGTLCYCKVNITVKDMRSAVWVEKQNYPYSALQQSPGLEGAFAIAMAELKRAFNAITPEQAPDGGWYITLPLEYRATEDDDNAFEWRRGEKTEVAIPNPYTESGCRDEAEAIGQWRGAKTESHNEGVDPGGSGDLFDPPPSNWRTLLGLTEDPEDPGYEPLYEPYGDAVRTQFDIWLIGERAVFPEPTLVCMWEEAEGIVHAVPAYFPQVYTDWAEHKICLSDVFGEDARWVTSYLLLPEYQREEWKTSFPITFDLGVFGDDGIVVRHLVADGSAELQGRTARILDPNSSDPESPYWEGLALLNPEHCCDSSE